MFKFEIVKKQKGYILLYTLILSFLCMLIVMLGFKLIIDEKENLYYFQKYVLNEKNNKKYTEYMLTFLTEFIKTKLVPMNKEGIKDCFKLYGDKSIASYEKSYIRYSVNKDSFIVTYQYSDGVLKKDEYDYEVIDGLIKYIYKNSIYESGRII